MGLFDNFTASSFACAANLTQTIDDDGRYPGRHCYSNLGRFGRGVDFARGATTERSRPLPRARCGPFSC
jgi:hypothetical protein